MSFQPRPRPGFLHRRLIVFAIALSVLLSGIATVQAQDTSWGGTVEVNKRELTIEKGKTIEYKLRLSKEPTGDNWWVMIWVNGQKRPDVHEDGGYEGLIWTPSLGWEVDQDNWTQWRSVWITAAQDADVGASVIFTHEVWDHNANCPVHNAAEVSVKVVEASPPPTLSIRNATVEEGEVAEFEVTLSASSSETVSVAYATAGDTATEGSDYTRSIGTLIFPRGTTARTVTVQTTDDTEQEVTERFTVVLSGPENATVETGTGTGTITDNDGAPPPPPPPPLPTLSIGAATVEEGEEAEFEVTLSAPSSETVRVDYATSGGTATEGSDYTGSSGTLTFTAGTTARTVTVQTTDDTEQEITERFTVVLSGPENATVETGTGTGTITDNDGAPPPPPPPPPLPTLSIGDATVEEGEVAEFEVRLSASSSETVSVAYATSGGTATEGSDYTGSSGTLTFTAGTTARTVTVQTTDDTEQEITERFTVVLSGPENATVETGTGTGTITDNDGAPPPPPPPPLPTLSVGAATVEEGEVAEFEVTLSASSSETVSVAYATAGGTATEGSDYTGSSGTLTFTAGTTARTVTVQTTDDTEQEITERFTVVLSGPENATVETGTGTGTITDNDGAPPPPPPPPLPTLSIGAATVEEGEEAEFEVRLSASSSETVSVAYATSGGTATEGSDYTGSSGTLTFTAGTTARTVTVQTTDDTEQEITERFTVVLSGPENATVETGTGTGTITDNDGAPPPTPPTPEVSIGDARADEGEVAEFEVRLSVTSAQAVTVGYATKDGTALAGTDYEAAEGTLTFGAGTTVKTVEVRTTEDELKESDEGFTVELSGPSGAVLGESIGTGTIVDDEATPEVTIGDARADEGEVAEFEVTLSGASDRAVTVEYRTVAGTAEAGVDYTAASGTLTFLAGSRRGVIEVETIEDELAESDEGFTVELRAPSGATLRDDTGTGTIIDDDTDTGTGDALPELSIADATAEEGETVELAVTLSKASADVVTVEYRTVAGTAEAGLDYTAASGTLTFLAGSRREVIEVATTEDELAESDEGFTVELRAPSAATLRADTGTGTIIDDDTDTGTGDALPELSIADATAEEGETVELAVTLSKASADVVTVMYWTVGGTALAGLDYTAASGTLTFLAGSRREVIEVETIEDELAESDEGFTVELRAPSGATLRDDTGTGTIIDDDTDTGTGDALPELSIADATAEEGETVELAVTLSKASDEAVTVEYRTAAGTAEEGVDYTAASGTLTFLAGSRREVIEVETIEDQLAESDEGFTVELRAPSGATLRDDTGTGTIIDDDTDTGTGDALPELSIADATAEEGGTVELAVTLSKASAQAVTVGYATEDGTALAGTDYEAAEGTLTFDAGATVKTVEVRTTEDELDELDEVFTVELSGPSGAVLGESIGAGTIADDEAAPEVSIRDARVDEGGTAEFEVTLSGASDRAVTVEYRTVAGTALAGTDYTAATGTLTFLAGSRREVIEVATVEDQEVESDEAFTVELRAPSGATLRDDTGTGTIIDDDTDTGTGDTLPELSIADATAEEGETVELAVTLSKASADVVTVMYWTVGGTALAGLDYTAASGTLTFLAGSRREVIEVETIEDELAESDEGFTVELRAPSGATLRDDTGTGTIIDDDTDTGTGDALPELSIADATAEEGETVELAVTLSKASEEAVTVEYRTVGVTAEAGLDYTAASGTLTFLAGSRREVIEVATIEDELAESDEGFTVELRAPSGATLRGDTGTGTIIDDDTDTGTGDALPELSIADATAEEGETVELAVTLEQGE